MTDISKAIARLKEDSIDSFELASVLVIPCNSAEEIYDLANKARRVFKEINFEKSWRIDPYYYNRHDSLSGQMYS